MSRLDRIRALHRHLTISTQTQGEQQDLDHLQNLTDKLHGPLEGLARQTARAAILQVPVSANPSALVREHLSALRTQLSESPASVGQGRVFQGFMDSVVDLNKKLREDADAAWTQRRQAALRACPASMFSFWESIPDLQEDARAVRRAVNDVQQRDRPVQEPGELKTFLESCDSIHRRAERLNQFTAPSAVHSFLGAARSTAGADWASLTDEVRAWLEEHALLDNLRIKLG